MMHQALPLGNRPFAFGRGTNDAKNPHHILRPHGTTVWILELTVSGRGRVYEPRTMVQETGDILLFAPMARQHYGMDSETGKWDHLWVCFTPPAPWLAWMDFPPLAPGISGFRLPRSLRSRMVALMEEGVRHSWNREPWGAAMAQNTLEKFFLLCAPVNPRSARFRRDPRIQAALDHMGRHYDEDLSIAALAARSNLSPSRFAHLFKKEMGTTPQKVLEDQRLLNAEALLLMSAKRITEIARETGFASPFYFSKVFRRKNGLSPRAFRGS